jgi:glycerophosphoryl diester phosphodiesterase
MAEGKFRVRNLGHRGASAHAPENTMRAFHLAEQLGADGMEFDVQLTKDGVPVVIHDELLKRTTGENGYVFEKTLAEIKRLDAGSWFGREFAGERIPTLEEVIAEFGKRMYLNIELKNSYFDMPGLENKTISLIRRYGVERHVIVSSFHHGSMQRFHHLAPDIPTGVLYDCVIVGASDYAKGLGASAIHPLFATIKPEIVQDAHAKGLAVNVWTANEKEHMRLLVHAGVDSIITNYPERLREVLEEAGAGK